MDRSCFAISAEIRSSRMEYAGETDIAPRTVPIRKSFLGCHVGLKGFVEIRLPTGPDLG